MRLVVSDTKDIWRIRVEDTDDDTPLDVANVLSAERGVDCAEPSTLQAATYAAEPQPSDSLLRMKSVRTSCFWR
jgi:hypothetical protein